MPITFLKNYPNCITVRYSSADEHRLINNLIDSLKLTCTTDLNSDVTIVTSSMMLSKHDEEDDDSLSSIRPYPSEKTIIEALIQIGGQDMSNTAQTLAADETHDRDSTVEDIDCSDTDAHRKGP